MREDIYNKAIEIRDETKEGANTAERVGNAFLSIHDNVYGRTIEEFTRDVITSDSPTPNIHKNVIGLFYENYHLLHGKYIESITFYADTKGQCQVLFAKNIKQSNFTYEVLLVDVATKGFQTVEIKRQLDSDETIGIGSIGPYGISNHPLIGVYEGRVNPIGGKILVYKERSPSTGDNTPIWSEDDLRDLCLTVTERVTVERQGDIPRIDEEISLLNKVILDLRHERRLTYTLASDEALNVFIDEEMTIYRLGAKDVLKATISINGLPTEIVPDTDIDLLVPPRSLLTITATPSATDIIRMHLFIYAKTPIL